MAAYQEEIIGISVVQKAMKMSAPEGFMICDDVPGPPSGYLVTRRSMTAAEVYRLKRIWGFVTENGHGKPVPIERDFRFDTLPGEPRQWPDAEFCAA